MTFGWERHPQLVAMQKAHVVRSYEWGRFIQKACDAGFREVTIRVSV